MTHSFIATTGALLVSLALSASVVSAQTLERRIASAPAGSVGFSFSTRDNVCGNGVSISISDDASDGWTTRKSRRGIHIGRHSSGYNEPCEMGPGRVTLERSGGVVKSVRVTVGGRIERANTDLGDVAASEASRYLLSIAPSLGGRSADNAVMGAAIADSSVIWRRLIEIARDEDASESSRKTSLFWLSHEASAAAVAGLDSIATDEDGNASVRADALFHLAQRPNGEGIPALIRVVKESKNRKLRRDAIWHLSQSGDARAITLFEQLLAGT